MCTLIPAYFSLRYADINYLGGNVVTVTVTSSETVRMSTASAPKPKPVAAATAKKGKEKDRLESIILDEKYDPDYEPSLDEIKDYADFLGMDFMEDQVCLWGARMVSACL